MFGNAVLDHQVQSLTVQDLWRTVDNPRKDGTSSYYCCVLRCTASSNINSYLSFHTFPKDKEMQKMWLDNIRRDFKITNQTRVCSRHFLSADLVEPSGPTGRRCLKDNAVPVLFHWNNFSFTVPAPCTGDWDSNDSLMFGKYSDHDYCSTAEPADALHLSLDHIEHSYAEKTCLRNKTAENSITHNSRICSGRSPASNDFRATEIEIADHSPGSDVPTQLCKSEQTETCTDSEEMISSPLGDTTSADEVDEGLLKIIKVEECEDFANFGEGTSSFLKQDISEEQQTKEVKEEEPEHECLYCEKCKSFYINKCEFHGPAVFIPDTPVPAGVTGRARLTLPLGLEVRQSEIFEAGLGVFNKGETIPVGVNFGPYEGELVDRDEALNSGYSWVNLVAFQYRGGIYYRCRQPIEPRQELLVWYSEEYPRDHSLEFNCLWNKKASMNSNV
ncbi:Histone-lysine N-methyltransferase PRDM9 [Bagarius yarrelli]|uniref:THAP domain-containing protein 1 n=1 Tax=Bagarius yarrelli TaxID=175774 RepID=A0A556U879_BAGYA|nr:Histone-lysine N-methyltransferase PRDM9 [Bagarius yarrelli]